MCCILQVCQENRSHVKCACPSKITIEMFLKKAPTGEDIGCIYFRNVMCLLIQCLNSSSNTLIGLTPSSLWTGSMELIYSSLHPNWTVVVLRDSKLLPSSSLFLFSFQIRTLGLNFGEGFHQKRIGQWLFLRGLWKRIPFDFCGDFTEKYFYQNKVSWVPLDIALKFKIYW